MITDVAAVVASIAVVAGLCWALYGWFKVSLDRFNSVVAKDVLAAWDAKLAKLSELTVNGCSCSRRARVSGKPWSFAVQRSRRFSLSYIRRSRGGCGDLAGGVAATVRQRPPRGPPVRRRSLRPS